MRGVACLVLAGITACAGNPATGVAANGRPLKVQYSTGVGTYVSDDKVGETVTTKSDGSEEVAEHFKPVEHAYRWHDWKYFQGREELDEQDFYRLAGDDDAVKKIEGIRASAARKMKLGAPIAAIGFVVMLLGATSNNESLSTLGYVGGSLTASGGGFLWYWGNAEMAKRHHLPPAHADEHADVIEDCSERGCRRQRGGRMQMIGGPPVLPPPPVLSAPPRRMPRPRR